MVQRNLELKRVFPGTWRDLQCSEMKLDPKLLPQPAPSPLLLLSANFRTIRVLPSELHYHPTIPSLKRQRTFWDLQGWEVEYNKKAIWGSSLLVPGWSPPAALHWISSSLKFHFIRCIFLYFIKYCSGFKYLHMCSASVKPWDASQWRG